MSKLDKLREARDLLDSVIGNVGAIGNADDLPMPDLVMQNGTVIGFVDNSRDQQIISTINAIQALAILNTDILHVFVKFSGHVNQLEVYAHSVNQQYKEGVEHIDLMRRVVWLDVSDALEKLIEIEKELMAQISNARQKAESKAEGDA